MKKFVIAVLLLATTGCATSKIAPNRAEIAKLQNVHAVTYEPAPFVLASAGKVAAGSLFGMIGGAVAGASMQKAGEELIATYRVPDPAIVVRERLATALAEQFQLQATPDTPPATDTTAHLQAKFGKEGAILDTRTANWQLLYYPSDWSHHFLYYAARARLVRLRDGKVLWQNYCVRQLRDPKESRRQVDAYRADDGALLKQKAQEAAEGCAEELIAHLRSGR